MNDMRLPGLRNGGLPAGRAEPAPTPLRGAAANDLDSFDRALQRSADARPTSDSEAARSARAPESPRPADEPQAAQRALDAARERSRAAERAEIQRHEQRRASERDRDGDSDRDGPRPAEAAAPSTADAARSPRQAPGARRAEAGAQPPNTDAADSAVDADTKAGDASAADAPRAGAEVVPLAVGTFDEVTRSLIAAAAAGSQLAANAKGLHGKAAQAEATDAAAASVAEAASAALPAERDIALPVHTDAKAAATPSAKSAPTGTHAEPRADAPGLTAAADVVHTPSRDRLLEDFERRFESSLARAAGTQGGSPLNPTGPLAAAGLPSAIAGSGNAMTVAYAGVAAPIGHPSFGNDLAHRVLLFAGQRVQGAEISVTPGELGPIRVSIDLRGQEAAMQFSAAHPTTRAAIEDALPRLREMLAAQGLQLTHANVGEHAPRHPGGSSDGQARHDGSPGRSGRDGGARPAGTALDASRAEAVTARRVGLIDIRV